MLDSQARAFERVLVVQKQQMLAMFVDERNESSEFGLCLCVNTKSDSRMSRTSARDISIRVKLLLSLSSSTSITHTQSQFVIDALILSLNTWIREKLNDIKRRLDG